MVVHVCNPSTLEGQDGWIIWHQEFETSTVSTKDTKISRVWWHVPVVLATREAEAGELLEPGRRRLQWPNIVPLHFSLGKKSETLSQKNKQAKKPTKKAQSSQFYVDVYD